MRCTCCCLRGRTPSTCSINPSFLLRLAVSWRGVADRAARREEWNSRCEDSFSSTSFFLCLFMVSFNGNEIFSRYCHSWYWCCTDSWSSLLLENPVSLPLLCPQEIIALPLSRLGTGRLGIQPGASRSTGIGLMLFTDLRYLLGDKFNCSPIPYTFCLLRFRRYGDARNCWSKRMTMVILFFNNCFILLPNARHFWKRKV